MTTKQPTLCDASKTLTCAFSEPWGPGTVHPLCAAESARHEALFWQDVAAGVYDAKGYKPSDRRAQQRRKAAA